MLASEPMLFFLKSTALALPGANLLKRLPNRLREDMLHGQLIHAPDRLRHGIVYP